MDFKIQVPAPVNEPVLSYAPGTPERAEIEATIKRMSAEQIDVPMFIGGEEIRTGKTRRIVMPHAHAHVLGHYHTGDASHVTRAIDAALKAKEEWQRMPFQARAAIFLRAADLLSGPYRAILNGATMLGQSKTPHQAEIDAACELADFWRFNVHYAEQIMMDQPLSPRGMWNMVDYRPLDGFVMAITPFNFTSIAGNLPTAPALMGNTVVWKPASTAFYSGWYILQILREAGLPDGVINLVAGSAAEIADTCMNHPDFGGLHYTGSTAVMQGMFRKVGENIANYKQYPRIVGETGGKDFIFALPSAQDDLEALATAIVRGGYEYQGQKCSAASRIYVPKSIWAKVKPMVLDHIAQMRMGDVADFKTFMGAVINDGAFRDITGYIDHAKQAADATIIAGGEYDDSEGYFIQPTMVEVTNPRNKLMVEEIFGPVVTVFPFEDGRLEETLKECDEASPYALTGAVFGRDRKQIVHAMDRLRHTAGNFYVNDKPTGAVVGQQPFGGGRASGTNDKAGSALNMIRWISPRTVKETFVPPTSPWYPYQG